MTISAEAASESTGEGPGSINDANTEHSDRNVAVRLVGGLGGAVCVCEWVGKGDMYMASLRMSSWCARIDV